MALRAVVFDYGMVLSGPPLAEAWIEMQRITGLSSEELHKLYWGLRPLYDEGKLGGLAYWRELGRLAGLYLSEPQIRELNDWDGRMWTTANPAMVAWQQDLKARGLKTAILSNMGDVVHGHVQRQFPWVERFDVQVWSYLLGVAKPDEAVYRQVLKELDVRPEETLFLDDKQPNIETAQRLGMKVHQFTTVERLREDLAGHGLDGQLPLPG